MAPNPPHKRFFLSVLPISKRSIKDTSVRHRWKFPLGLAGLELALGLSYGKCIYSDPLQHFLSE